MKQVIYKANDIFHITSEANYNARIQNARAIHQLKEFTSIPEIIDYYCTHFGSKLDDFLVVTNAGIENWLDAYHLAKSLMGEDNMMPEAVEVYHKFKEGGI